jgi:hypothetical protein
MNRRKKHVRPSGASFHERRKRWVDRRQQGRWLGILMVPVRALKRWTFWLFNLEFEGD